MPRAAALSLSLPLLHAALTVSGSVRGGADRAYYLGLLQDVFSVLTDTLHKPGFKLHSQILATLFLAVEGDVGIATVPGPPPRSSALLEEGAAKIGWRSTEFPRAFQYDERGRGTKQTMARTLIPRAVAAGAELLADTRVRRVVGSAPRATGARARRTGRGERPLAPRGAAN